MPDADRPPRAVRIGPLPVAAAILILDQTTKELVRQTLGPDHSDHRLGLIEPVLALHYVENTGAAFSLLRDQSALLTALTLLILGGVLVAYRRMTAPSPAMVVGLGLVAGGAIGNLVDRIRFGYVVDFVAVGMWPKFNVADSAITVGMLLLVWRLMTSDQPSAASHQPLAGRRRQTLASPGPGRPSEPSD